MSRQLVVAAVLLGCHAETRPAPLANRAPEPAAAVRAARPNEFRNEDEPAKNAWCEPRGEPAPELYPALIDFAIAHLAYAVDEATPADPIHPHPYTGDRAD